MNNYALDMEHLIRHYDVTEKIIQNTLSSTKIDGKSLKNLPRDIAIIIADKVNSMTQSGVSTLRYKRNRTATGSLRFRIPRNFTFVVICK